METLEVMTLAEVAAYLRLDPRTVLKMAEAGELPYVRLGKKYRFHRAAIERMFMEPTNSNGNGHRELA